MSKVTVTGSSGFLGRKVVSGLRDASYEIVEVPHREFDLLDRNSAIRAFQHVDAAIHVAAMVGGIVFNDRMPGKIWLENTMMGVNVLDAVFSKQVERFVIVGTACSYPDICPEEGWLEGDLSMGRPTEENAAYGIAKAGIIEGAKALTKQEKLRHWGAIILANLYGPGDHFGPKAHVIPDLILKFIRAKTKSESRVRLYGSGKEQREFLYVKDAAAAVVRFFESLTQEQDGYRIVNFGSGEVLSIEQIARTIAHAVGYKGTIEWSGKLRGQAVKRLNLAKAKSIGLGVGETTFEDGLSATIEWAVKHITGTTQGAALIGGDHGG